MKYYLPRDEYTGHSVVMELKPKPPMRYKLKILRQLGRGNNGVAYLVERKGKEFILKYQVLHNSKHRKRQINQEQQFFAWYKELPSKDKKFFMNHYESAVVRQDDNVIEIESLLEYIPGNTLSEFIQKNHDISLLREIYIQVLYIINKMQLDGWFHGDLHSNNLICRKIDKSITMNTKCGFIINNFQVVAIDYGEAIHIKNKHLNIRDILNIVFDIERIYITHYLCMRIHDKRYSFPKTVTVRLHKFKKHYPGLYTELLVYMKKTYNEQLNERAKLLFGTRYVKYNISTIIKSAIKKCVTYIDNKDPINFNKIIAWPLFYIEILAIIRYELEYCKANKINKSIKTLLPKTDIYDILTTISETQHDILLCRITNKIHTYSHKI